MEKKIMNRTIIPYGATVGNTDRVPVSDLPADDQVRVGFEKGTLMKATFELSFGAKVIYEIDAAHTPRPGTALRRNGDD